MWFAQAINSKIYFREVGGLDIQAVIMWRGVNVVLSTIMGSEVGGLGFVWGISRSSKDGGLGFIYTGSVSPSLYLLLMLSWMSWQFPPGGGGCDDGQAPTSPLDTLCSGKWL